MHVVHAHRSNNTVFFVFRTRHFQQWAIPEKIQTWAKEIGNMEIPLQGVLKKRHTKIRGSN